MYFGSQPVEQAEGALLAHKLKLPNATLAKGHALTGEDIELIKAAGITDVLVARLEDSDVLEDTAADTIAAAIIHASIAVEPAARGRVNLYADVSGLLCLDQSGLDSLNSVNESITLATRTPFSVVHKGDLVATIKIIPFAVHKSVLDACLELLADHPQLLTIAAFSPKRIALVQTSLPDTRTSLLDKTGKVLGDRLRVLDGTIVLEQRCDHSEPALTACLQEVLARDVDLVMVIGASAIVDRRDIIPASLVNSGGEVLHFGMPAEPGNLMMLGKHQHRTVLGLPGCARSTARNGLDMILERLAADLPVTPKDLMLMGAGGLLKQTLNRE